MKLDMRTSTNYLHKTLNILKVEHIHKSIVLTFVNACLMEKCPHIFQQYFKVKVIPYTTRQSGDLYMPLHKKGYGARSLKVIELNFGMKWIRT